MNKNEGYVYQNLLYKTKKNIPKIQINDLLRITDLQKTFSKTDKTNWSYKSYKITEFINATIPIYRIDNLPERYNEALLKKTELNLKENKDNMKALNVN